MIVEIEPREENFEEFFWPKDDDKARLLERIEIASLIEVASCEEQQISRPLSGSVIPVKHGQRKLHHRELEACMKILKSTKINRPCRRTFIERSKEIARLWTCRNPAAMLCLVGVPAVLLAGWLLHHFYLVHERNLEVVALNETYALAKNNWRLFSSNYTSALHTLELQIYANSNISEIFGSNFTWMKNWLHDSCHLSNMYIDICTYSSSRIDATYALHLIMKSFACDHPRGTCWNVSVCQLVLGEMARLEVIRQANDLAYAAVDAFIKQYESEKTRLEALVVDLQAQIEAPDHSLWSVSLGVCLLMAWLFSITYVLFLYRDRKQAEGRLHTDQYLEENVHPEFVPRIINLCAELDASLIDMPVDDMIKVLRLKLADYKLLFTSFCTLKDWDLPRDLIALILKKMCSKLNPS